MFKSNKHKLIKANIIKGRFIESDFGKHYLKIRLAYIKPLNIKMEHGIGDVIIFSNSLKILLQYPEKITINFVKEFDKKIKILNLLDIKLPTTETTSYNTCDINSYVFIKNFEHSCIQYGNDLINSVEAFTGFKFSDRCKHSIPTTVINKTKPIVYEYAISNSSKHFIKTVPENIWKNRIIKYLTKNNIKFINLDHLSYDNAIIALEQSEKYIGIDSLWAHLSTVFKMKQLIFWNKESPYHYKNFYYPNLQKLIFMDNIPNNIFNTYESDNSIIYKINKSIGNFKDDIKHYLGPINRNQLIMPQIDINITMKCTMSCTECTRLLPAFKGISQKDRTPAELYEDMSKISKSVTFTSGIIIGGEPTLHSNLLECIMAVKRSGVCKYIMLATNGTTINKIKDEIIDNVDIFRLTVYPNKIDESDILEFEDRLAKKGKKLEKFYPTKFYAIYSKTEIKERNIQKCWQFCEKCFNYYDRRLYMCGPAHQINKIQNTKNIDGMDLLKISNEEIKDNIIYRTEYNACKNCFLCSNKGLVQWSESTRKEWYETH